MNGFIFGLAAFCVASTTALAQTRDAASQFVQTTFERGQRIVELKSENEKKRQLCQLISQRVATVTMANVFLGDFAKLERDKAGITEFRKLVPSIFVTQALPNLKDGDDGSFNVNPRSSDRGNGIFEVPVTVHVNGRPYNLSVILKRSNNRFMIIDGEYLGYSGIQYLARDYQDQFQEEYQKDPNSSKPVSAVVLKIKSQDGFVSCR